MGLVTHTPMVVALIKHIGLLKKIEETGRCVGRLWYIGGGYNQNALDLCKKSKEKTNRKI